MENREKDLDAIRELFTALNEAWNNGDGTSYGECFTEDADYVTFIGQHLKGRKQIAEVHQWLFNGPLRRQKWNRTLHPIFNLVILRRMSPLSTGSGKLSWPIPNRILTTEAPSIRMLSLDRLINGSLPPSITAASRRCRQGRVHDKANKKNA